MTDIGDPKAGLMNIGQEVKPPYAVLPDPSSLFLTRSRRFEALAPEHELAPYLWFLAAVTRAQHEILRGLPQASLPHVSAGVLEDEQDPPDSRMVRSGDSPIAPMDPLGSRWGLWRGWLGATRADALLHPESPGAP
jgi:hypothetical protein